MAQIINIKDFNKDFNHYLEKLHNLCENDLRQINEIIISKITSKIPLNTIKFIP